MMKNNHICFIHHFILLSISKIFLKLSFQMKSDESNNLVLIVKFSLHQH